MSWLLFQLFRAVEWVFNKSIGYCHPYCDYSKCLRTTGRHPLFPILLTCTKCGRITRC